MGVAAESDGTQGTVWECPDLFPLGSKHCLLVSPLGPAPRRVLYFLGELDYGTGRFKAETAGELDRGPDFYAPQTFAGADRPILLAWMQSWKGEIPTTEHNWAGALTLPRELALDSAGRLVVRPLAELEKLRSSAIFRGTLALTDGAPPFDLSQGGLEVILRADPAGTGASEYGILFRTAHGRERFTVGISQGRGEVYLDITGIPSSRGGVYSLQLPAKNGRVELRFFLDRSSLELFAAGAPCSITARLYPSSPLLVPELFTCGGALQAAVELWSLKAGTG
ncbi:MAG: GH32 C-terminal domain-containing protein [Limnochordia bacterium]